MDIRGSLEAADVVVGQEDQVISTVDDLRIKVDTDCQTPLETLPGLTADASMGDFITIMPVMGETLETPAIGETPDMADMPESVTYAEASGFIDADGRRFTVVGSACALPEEVDLNDDEIVASTFALLTDEESDEPYAAWIVEFTDEEGLAEVGETATLLFLGPIAPGAVEEFSYVGLIIEEPVIETFVGAGTYELMNVDLDRYLASSGPDNRANVITSPESSDASHWEFIDNGDGTWLVRNVATGGYLDGDGANRDWNVDQSIAPRSDDRWIVTDVGNNEWTLRNARRGRLLDADRNHQDWNVDLAVAERGDRKWEFTLIDQ